jgi:hypothetical protein
MLRPAGKYVPGTYTCCDFCYHAVFTVGELACQAMQFLGRALTLIWYNVLEVPHLLYILIA